MPFPFVQCSFDQFLAIRALRPMSIRPVETQVDGGEDAPNTYKVVTQWVERTDLDGRDGDEEEAPQEGRVVLQAVREADLLPATPGTARRQVADETIRLSWWVDQAVLEELYSATPISA